MVKSHLRAVACPHCGYTFGHSQGETIDERCPKCGARVQGRRRQPVPLVRILLAAVLLAGGVSGLTTAFLVATNEGVATELRQFPQARPNRFHVALDVSATIGPGVLKDIKAQLIGRLGRFMGEPGVAYEVFVFGLPGCGADGIRRIVSTVSPATAAAFTAAVAQPIDGIRITRRSDADGQSVRLTTPLYRMLEILLSAHPGERIIVISDLVNDEYGCNAPAPFPLKAITDFGTHAAGQIEFLYTAPHMVGELDTPAIREAVLREQQQFIARVQALQREGKIRAWFHPVPEAPDDRQRMLADRLQDAIPATTIEMVWARVRQLMAVIVLGIRG